MRPLALAAVITSGFLWNDYAVAQLPPSANIQEPVRFYGFSPCIGSASFCGSSYAAIGTIDDTAAERLRALNPPERSVVYFHSPGGSLLGGIELGRAIRALKLDVVTGFDLTEESFSNGTRTLFQDTYCASACTLAFLGGIRREIGRANSFLMHQFSTGQDLLGEGDTQFTVALLAKYLDEMGVDRRFLDASLLTRPESLAYYSLQDLVTFGIYNAHISSFEFDGLVKSGWRLHFAPDGRPQVVLLRTKEHFNGVVNISLTNLGDSRLELEVRIKWNVLADRERLLAAREMVVWETLAGKRIRPRYTVLQMDAASGDSPVWRSDFAPSSWTFTDSEWVFRAELDSGTLLHAERFRPVYLRFESALPGYLGEFDLYETFELDPVFWDLVRLAQKSDGLWDRIVRWFGF